MKQRIDWIDLVKATSVLLVVFMHASGSLFDIAGDTTVSAFLLKLNHAIEPLRMPVFFLASGMLAASAIARPWSQTTKRTLGMVYLYVLWMTLLMALKLLFGVTTADPLADILFAKSGFWYLYAMALFFVIARLLRNQPAWLVVVVALVPNLLRPATQIFFEDLIPGSLATSMAMNLGFFLLGAYFKETVGAMARRATWPVVAVLGATAVFTTVVWLNNPANAGQSYLGLSLLWVAAGVGAAALVTRGGAPAWSRYVGSRTLAIYVWQWPVIFLLFELWPRGTLGSPVAQVIFPLALTAVIALSGMWLHNQPRLRVLFNAPDWVLNPRRVPTRPEPVAVPG